ncbi:MATE family efflux transporter [Anaerotignum sp.]|nr:MATE family efflux transporter [Anaerotignum sp.]MBQ7758592.1 MATE family efflux transporter [Anaerotignum sp.]
MENENMILGQEKISKLLLKFSVPCVMGLLISALYNIVDQIFIGNSELGYLGNAATGVSFPVICIANAFAWCVGDGAASYLSICAGRKDSDSAHKCVGTGITVTFLISIVLLLICQLFATPLMSLFGASSQTLDMAVEYFRIVAAFFPFYLLLNVMNSMIRADGSPAFAMAAMLTGAVINIILDPVFIFLLKWGIAGAAWATAIGQVASFVVCAVYFRKPKSFVLTKRSFLPDGAILRSTISLGAATFVTQISIVVLSLVGNMTLAHYGALSKYGPDIPISVFSIQTKVYTVVCNIVTGIVLGGQPIFGYNYGAKRMDRVRETYQLVLKSTLVVGIVATLIFQLRPELVIGIFGSGNALYQEFAIKTFRIYLSLMSITCLVKMTAVFFQSIGKSVRAVVASLIRDIVCFTPLALFLPRFLESAEAGNGINGILFAAPMADMVAVVVILCLTVPFFRGLKKEEKAEEIADCIIKASQPGTIITINREHGTAGKQIGKVVAEKLNIPFYYKEMTALAAQESGLDKAFISDLNDNAPGILNELYLSTTVVKQAVIAQEQVIHKIADNGACVIVGRAADYVLRNYDNVIRIFIHAPKEYRVNKIMEMYGDTREEAYRYLKRSDDARAAYYRNISGQNWGEPRNYTLCLDASMGIDTCAELICSLVKK